MSHCRKPLFIPPFLFFLMLIPLHAIAQEPPEPAEWKSSDASAQNPQDKPDEKKEANSNRAQAPAEKRKDLTTQAAEATSHMAHQALVRMRDWETECLTGVCVYKRHA